MRKATKKEQRRSLSTHLGAAGARGNGGGQADGGGRLLRIAQVELAGVHGQNVPPARLVRQLHFHDPVEPPRPHLVAKKIKR